MVALSRSKLSKPRQYVGSGAHAIIIMFLLAEATRYALEKSYINIFYF